jgi:putative resolvase
MKVGIGRAATELGVSRDTLRRWEAAGKITVERTPKGHRRYDLAQLRSLAPMKTQEERITLVYARVLGREQKKELKNQIATLESFCVANGWKFEVIQDFGSGMNYHKSGLRNLVRRLCQGDVGRLVVTHRDRLLRFGIDLVFSICEHFGTEVVIVNAMALSNFEEELAQDVLDIIAVFSARLYGSRNQKNFDIIQRLQQIARELEGEASKSMQQLEH